VKNGFDISFILLFVILCSYNFSPIESEYMWNIKRMNDKYT